MSLREEVFALSLDSLRWMGLREGSFVSIAKHLLKRASTRKPLGPEPRLIVAEVVDMFNDKSVIWSPPLIANFKYSLVECGLSQFDWVELSKHTATPEALAKLSKEELLAVALLCFSGFGPKVMGFIANRLHRLRDPIKSFLVGDVLAIDWTSIEMIEAFTDRAAIRDALRYIVDLARAKGVPDTAGPLMLMPPKGDAVFKRSRL